MFSSRTQWHRQPNALARRLADARASGRRIIDLTVSNPTRAGLEYPADEIRAALASDGVLEYAPHPRGLRSAREAVARYYGERSILVDPDHILLTSGSSEGYSFLLRLLCDPGASVLVPSPSYPLFDYLADLTDVRCIPYHLTFDDAWHVDAGPVLAAAGPSGRAIILVHPNNPTGTFLTAGGLRQIAAVAREREMALIVDEVFIDYPLSQDPLRAGSTAAFDEVLTFTINGLSKAAALPQMKLGWVTVSGPEDRVREALERLEIIADTFLSVNTPVQHALPRLLDLGAGLRSQIRSRSLTNLAMLRDRLTRVPRCSLLPADGGWYATIRVPATRTDEEWALALLEEEGVYVHPGFLFDFPAGGHLVVSLLTPEEECAGGVEGMARLLEREE
jgi:alanine-synthesizing transaminase